MMSSVLSNILGWPGGNVSKQVRLYSHAHFETWLCHTGSTNTCSLWFVDTFDKSQTSIQHNYTCDFMNMKEEKYIFLRNEWTTTGEVDKTNRTDPGKCIHLYDETQGNIKICINILNQFFFASTPCLSSSLLPSSFIIIYLLTPDEEHFLSKVLVFHCSLCFVVLVNTFP